MQPFVKLDHFPTNRGNDKKIFELPPPRFSKGQFFGGGMEDNVVKNGIFAELKGQHSIGALDGVLPSTVPGRKIVIRIGTPPKCNIDTKKDDTENVSPFKYGCFGMSVLNFRKANI